MVVKEISPTLRRHSLSAAYTLLLVLGSISAKIGFVENLGF